MPKSSEPPNADASSRLAEASGKFHRVLHLSLLQVAALQNAVDRAREIAARSRNFTSPGKQDPKGSA
jgi:hypothetical protein